MEERFYIITNLEKHTMESKKKQFCGYCPEDKCLLDCDICYPKTNNDHSCNY